jgi:2,5-diketo-D-gluconate reductase A
MHQVHKSPSARLSGGSDMPLMGFGTWDLRDEGCYTAVRHALGVGYRQIDTATGYENELAVGRALRDSGLAREEIFVTTKLPPDHAGRERQTLEQSLRDLGIEYVDLWLVHWPPGGSASPDTWTQFIALREDGLVREIGVSNYSTDQTDELITATGVAPAVNQISWGPSLYDPIRLRANRDRGIVLGGYSPLKNTDLTDPSLLLIAESHRVTPEQVVLRWHLEHGVIAIPKSSRFERIESNFDVFGFQLSSGEIASIDGLSTVATLPK